VTDQWITRSEEEGVFLCRRARSASQFSPWPIGRL